MTVKKYTYVKWQWIFYFLHRCFLSSITAKTATGLNCIYEYNDGCLLRSGKGLTFASNWIHPQFFAGVRVAHHFSGVLLCVITFWVPCYDIRYDFQTKRCSVRFCLQLFIGGIMSYVCCLWFFADSGVKHRVCCVFFLFHCVPCVANFSGLCIFDCPFSIL